MTLRIRRIAFLALVLTGCGLSRTTNYQESDADWWLRSRPQLVASVSRDAAGVFMGLGMRPQAIDAYLMVARAYRSLARPDSALRFYERSLEVAAETVPGEQSRWEQFFSWMLNSSANVHGGTDAVMLLEAQKAHAYRGIGEIRAEAAMPDSARHYLHRALDIQREVLDWAWETGVHEGELASFDGETSYLRSLCGEQEFDSEIQACNDEVRRREEQRVRLPKARSELALTYDALGRTYEFLGWSDSASAYLHEALAEQEGANDVNQGLTLVRLGELHQQAGRPDSARHYFERAREVPAWRMGRPGLQAQYDRAIAGYLVASGQPDSALVHFERSLERARDNRDAQTVVRLLLDIGDLLRSADDPPGALLRYREALAESLAGELGGGEAAARQAIASVQLEISPDSLRVALPQFDSAAAVLGAIADRISGDEDRLSFEERTTTLFDEWALAAIRASPTPQEGAWAGLAVSERGRAQALLSFLLESSEDGPVEVPAPGADLAAEGRALATRSAGPGEATLAYAATPDTLLIWMIEPTGAIRMSRTPITRDALAELVGRYRDELGADEAVRGRVVGGDAPESPWVDASRSAIGTAGIEARRSRPAAARLSEILFPVGIRESLTRIRDVMVVPGGPLGVVTFASLVVPGARGPLGASHAIRYAPSLRSTALVGVPEQRPRSAPGRAVVVGNPAMPVLWGLDGTPIPLRPLPGAEREAERVAELLGADLMTGPGASEAEVRRLLPTASVVHLATHGLAYGARDKSHDSFVALGPGEGLDGLLTVRELIADLPPFESELVVLSACQTGLGYQNAAEGTVGLARAFLARGSHSVLVSLWSVSDEATELLMTRFFEHWLNDSDAPDKAEALRRAQEDVRDTPGFDSPYHWAPFQLLGAR